MIIRRVSWGFIIALWLMATCVGSSPTARAQSAFDAGELTKIFPEHGGRLTASLVEGAVPSAAIKEDGRLIGYAFSTRAVTGSVGYGGKPIDVHAGLDLYGRISGALLVAHEEPILVIGVSPQSLAAFVAGLAGLDVRQSAVSRTSRRPGVPDHVAGATVSSTVIKAAVLRAGRAVAIARGIIPAPGAGHERIDTQTIATKTWPELQEQGAIAHARVSNAEAGRSGSNVGGADIFLDLYAALLAPPAIGQNLLGQQGYERLHGNLADGAYALLIAAQGAYSFKGTAWRQSGTFDRIQLEQGSRTITFRAEEHENVEHLAIGGHPALREIGIFTVRQNSGFNPALPWRLTLLVEPPPQHEGQNGRHVTLNYRLPQDYLMKSGGTAEKLLEALSSQATSAQEGELWLEIWRSKRYAIAVTAAMLLALLVVLFSHDVLVRDVQRYRTLRLSFLGLTVLFLGIYAGAQLSVVHIVTFAHAVLSGFKWDQFLLDPLSFVLWSFVALCLLFWGRGVFCGWLCPFGALQELLNEIARAMGVKQINVPWSLHERLWPIKYVVFLLILGLSFKSVTDAFAIAEVEPFKTVVAFKFVRAWPYLLYALILLGAGLFIERFFCRYLCPLGAALAIPARLRLFEWLKRRPQCGRECRICATRCTVQAINPIGTIVPNECIYCLQCQANYYDSHICLPLVQRVQRRAPQSPHVASSSIKPEPKT